MKNTVRIGLQVWALILTGVSVLMIAAIAISRNSDSLDYERHLGRLK